jgi:hypothetical protein
LFLLCLSTVAFADPVSILRKSLLDQGWTPERLAETNKYSGPARGEAFDLFFLRLVQRHAGNAAFGNPDIDDLVEISKALSDKYPFRFHTRGKNKRAELLTRVPWELLEAEEEEAAASVDEKLLLTVSPIVYVVPRPTRYAIDSDGEFLLSQQRRLVVRRNSVKKRGSGKAGGEESFIDVKFIFDKEKTVKVNLRSPIRSQKQILSALYLIAQSERHRHLLIELFDIKESRKDAFEFPGSEGSGPYFNIELVKNGDKVPVGPIDDRTDEIREKHEVEIATGVRAKLECPSQSVWLVPRLPNGFHLYVKPGIPTGLFIAELVYRLQLLTNSDFYVALEPRPLEDLRGSEGAGRYRGYNADYTVLRSFQGALAQGLESSRTIVRELVDDWAGKDAVLQNTLFDHFFAENRDFWKALPPKGSLLSSPTDAGLQYLLPEIGIGGCPEETLRGFMPPNWASAS